MTCLLLSTAVAEGGSVHDVVDDADVVMVTSGAISVTTANIIAEVHNG